MNFCQCLNFRGNSKCVLGLNSDGLMSCRLMAGVLYHNDRVRSSGALSVVMITVLTIFISSTL